MPTNPETIYYQSNDVLVTNTRAEMSDKTFSMSNITSVSLVEIPPKQGGAAFLMVVGLMVAGMAFCVSSSESSAKWFTGAISLLCLAVAFWLMISAKTQYAVSVTSASGESRGMQSADRTQIQEIVTAIKQAIIDGGVQRIETASGGEIPKSGDNTLQKLKSLKDMFEAGVITAQEYETKKADILAKM